MRDHIDLSHAEIKVSVVTRLLKIVSLVGACLASAMATSVLAQQIEVAQIKTGDLDLTVTGACLDGDAVFRIVNNGADWSVAREILVYRFAGDILVNKRKLTMEEGDNATFKVRGAAKSGAKLGLIISGDDMTRLTPYDASLDCGK